MSVMPLEYPPFAKAAVDEAMGNNWSDLDDTLRHAVLGLAHNGITAVRYTADSGRVIAVPTDVAVRRAVRTEMTQRINAQTISNLEELEYNLVEVSSCSSARESHADWQGQVYQLKGKGKYPNYHDACRVGDLVDGIGGYNCDHTVGIHIEGHELRPSTQDPLRGTGYTPEQAREATAKQRQLENEIRKLKRERDVSKQLELDASDVNAKLRRYEQALKDHVNANSQILRLQPGRTNVYSPSMARAGVQQHLNAEQRRRIYASVGRPRPAQAAGVPRIPAPRKLVDEAIEAIERQGGRVERYTIGSVSEIAKRMSATGASASCLGDVVTLPDDATISEVLEESRHFWQNSIHMNTDVDIRATFVLNEIEAKEYLIANQKLYNIPEAEMIETRTQLEAYRAELERLKQLGIL